MTTRVLLVLGYSNRGGAARSVLELAQHLPSEGFDVTVAAPAEPTFERELAETGARFLAVPMSGRRDWRSCMTLARTIRREQFDVVHTQCRNADLHGGLAALIAGAPALVVHLRGLLVDGDGVVAQGAIDRLHRAFLARVPDRIVAISEAVRRRALELLALPPERIVTVLNGVDGARLDAAAPDARSRLRSELRLPKDSALLLTIGTLGRCKGQDIALRALRELPDPAHLAHLVFVGAGSARGELSALANELGVAARVHFLGERDDVADLLAACDLLVHPSRWEGFGRVVAEAMAAGRPVVASDVGGIPEIVAHERTGLLVPPERPELLAAAIARLLADRSLATRLGRTARDFARDELDATRAARGLADVLRSVVRGTPSRRDDALAEALP